MGLALPGEGRVSRKWPGKHLHLEEDNLIVPAEYGNEIHGKRWMSLFVPVFVFGPREFGTPGVLLETITCHPCHCRHCQIVEPLGPSDWPVGVGFLGGGASGSCNPYIGLFCRVKKKMRKEIHETARKDSDLLAFQCKFKLI